MNSLPVLKNFFSDDLFEIDSIMENFYNPVTKDCKINLKEKEKEFELTAVTPGINKENLSVEYKNGLLTIKGETKCSDKKDTDKYIYREIKCSNFNRSFRVDEDSVDIENIKSTYVDGVLKIIIPKKNPEKRKGRTILIE